MIEALLVILVVSLVVGAVLTVTSLSGAALRIAAAFFTAPMRPPTSLSRLVAMVEMEVAEREAAAAARTEHEPPPPEIVLALRAAAHPERPPESLARIAALVEQETRQRLSAAPSENVPPPEIVLALRAATGSRDSRGEPRHRPCRRWMVAARHSDYAGA